MCGIAGWMRWEPGQPGWSRAVVDRMVSSLKPRGPDDDGVEEYPRASFGHARLAIIDVDGGHQPMCVDGAMVSFSGEIYNYRILRTDLRRLGHRFDTSSDTEVLLRSYLEWGDDCLERLDGMFAFAIWDERRRRLLLARDRLGVKPLYVARLSDGLVFGSEPKALFCHPDIAPRIDDEGLAMIMASFGTHQPGRSPYCGVDEVAAGTMLTAADGRISTKRYWALPALAHREDFLDTVSTTRHLVESAVSNQLESEVPLCSLLSGGLDSSLVTTFAQRKQPSLMTYSVGFAGEEDHFVPDPMRPTLDRPFAELLVDKFELHHTPITLEPDHLAAAQEAATGARDLPSMGNLDASLYLLFQAISDRATVALSGEAADEVFGGYHWFHDDGVLERQGFPWAPPGGGLGDVLRPDLRDRIQPAGYVQDLYSSAVAETPVLDGESEHERRRRQISYLALTRFLPVLLDRKDRMSMASGLEVRVPYCDRRLVEYVFNVPWEFKAKGSVPKALLREVGYENLPFEICERAKSAYPVAADPGYEQNLRTIVATALDHRDSFIAGIVDRAKVGRLLDGSSDKPPWMQNLALGYLDQVDRWATGIQLELT